MAAKAKQAAPKQVDPELLQAALAKAVATGDIINFRLIFASFSPGRIDSTERFEDAKYAYLQPSADLQNEPRYRDARQLLNSPEIRAHIEREIAAKRPAQLPYEPLLMLADNAVRLGKYTSAAQAYEILRIRRRMQELFYDQGDAALESGDMPTAVTAFRTAAALDYDYAGFPEPMPKVPDYQKRALIVHARYPARTEDSIPLMPESDLVNRLTEFLLNDAEAMARLAERPLDVRTKFAVELVRQVDPEWDAFLDRYAAACSQTRSIGEALLRKDGKPSGVSLEEEIAEQQTGAPRDVMATLLGQHLEPGDWWEYLKELALRHPASIFFISRQLVGENEVLLPRYRAGSALVGALGLKQADAQPAQPA